jgi:hypothetical protein
MPEPSKPPSAHLRTYKVWELERIAQTQLNRLQDDFSLPVDIEKVLEETPGVDLDIWPKLQANHGLMGMVGTDDTGTMIVYIDDDLADADHLLRRYRMTVAEEYAHILLHRDAIGKVRSPADFKELHNDPDWQTYDRNAKRLAAALLIPASQVLSDSRLLYSKMVSVAGYGDPEAIKKMIKNKLADRYVVSTLSMGYRLSEWPVEVMSKIDEAVQHQLAFLV